MKSVGMCFLVVTGLLAIPFLTMRAQESGSKSSVTVSATTRVSQRLTAGQTFNFQLEFDKVPSGLDKGLIDWVLQRQMGGAVDPGPLVSGLIDIHPHQAIYPVSIPITESMMPGRWKLIEVRIGSGPVMTQVKLTDEVTFEVVPPTPPSPWVVKIEAPDSVVAGQKLTFKVDVGKIPVELGPGCIILLSGQLAQDAGL